MRGIVAYGGYGPRFRLQRAAIAAALGAAPIKGARSVASYDEDTTTMAVEAGRRAIATSSELPSTLYFATAAPAYLDKSNASAVHGGLGLDPHVGAYDVLGGVRSGVAAVRAALDAATIDDVAMAVLSDIRTGLPGSSDESQSADGAAALILGRGPGVIAELLGRGCSTTEFLDRWRAPGELASHLWEERFVEQAYAAPASSAVADALKMAGVDVSDIDHVIVSGLPTRAVRRVTTKLGASRHAIAADQVTGAIGNAGTAQSGLALAGVLDTADPGQLILQVTLADGADVLVWRTTDALATFAARRQQLISEQINAANCDLPYTKFLTWRGMLGQEPPRRPDPDRPAAPPSWRREAWKFGFVASRCSECGARQLPPARVCLECGCVDQMVPERLADTRGTIATFTVDHLSYTPSPPIVASVVDFDGGGRFPCELTDVDPAQVHVGTRVEMTFRRLYTAGGIHNYFWKARPVGIEEG